MMIADHTESLREAERRLQAAQLASDVDALDDLIEDTALFTGPDGSVLSKRDDLQAHASGYQVMSRVEEEDLRVLVTAGTGVTLFLGTLEGTFGGERLAARMRYTRTWTLDDRAGWKVIAAHAAIVGDAPAEG
ncbi:nuclear transport factor 2 family protein [Promicromonospora iranensis]|jgi:ketosteroid isomerase-like protein|uniref:nuclear transport factor 2 family protein n=1 Tax=Promicromonospora iranensis TaxID=1105144 RepID=UPI0023A9318F|nr:nuclear transport factor 2 family protein [Promicromonospora iranensis]